jgi:hypothetical protein
LNDLVASEKLKNVALILNDVKTGGKYGYYGFGAGYGKYLEATKLSPDKQYS